MIRVKGAIDSSVFDGEKQNIKKSHFSIILHILTSCTWVRDLGASCLSLPLAWGRVASFAWVLNILVLAADIWMQIFRLAGGPHLFLNVTACRCPLLLLDDAIPSSQHRTLVIRTWLFHYENVDRGFSLGAAVEGFSAPLISELVARLHGLARITRSKKFHSKFKHYPKP